MTVPMSLRYGPPMYLWPYGDGRKTSIDMYIALKLTEWWANDVRANVRTTSSNVADVQMCRPTAPEEQGFSIARIVFRV